MEKDKPTCPNCAEDAEDMIDEITFSNRYVTYYCNTCGREFVIKVEEEKQKVQ